MKIDWFTFVAQILNFLFFVWLLKRFLYKPILNAIEEREIKIASQLEEAANSKADAQKERNELMQKNNSFEQERKELMNKSISEVRETRHLLLEEARNDASLLRSKLEKEMLEIQDSLSRTINHKVQQEVFSIVRKTLSELASISLEEQAVNVFIARLTNLKEEERKLFINAFNSQHKKILISSTFTLSPECQNKIMYAISNILGDGVQCEFKTAPELISGIELTTNGYKLTWSIASYIQSLEKSLSETIGEKPMVAMDYNAE